MTATTEQELEKLEALANSGAPTALRAETLLALIGLARRAIRAAAAEPVAWMKNHGQHAPSFTADHKAAETWAMQGKPLIPLYTAAPAQAATDEVWEAAAAVRKAHEAMEGIEPRQRGSSAHLSAANKYQQAVAELITAALRTSTPADDSQKQG